MLAFSWEHGNSSTKFARLVTPSINEPKVGFPNVVLDSIDFLKISLSTGFCSGTPKSHSWLRLAPASALRHSRLCRNIVPKKSAEQRRVIPDWIGGVLTWSHVSKVSQIAEYQTYYHISSLRVIAIGDANDPADWSDWRMNTSFVGKICHVCINYKRACSKKGTFPNYATFAKIHDFEQKIEFWKR